VATDAMVICYEPRTLVVLKYVSLFIAVTTLRRLVKDTAELGASAHREEPQHKLSVMPSSGVLCSEISKKGTNTTQEESL
jgi:hypothetical protein